MNLLYKKLKKQFSVILSLLDIYLFRLFLLDFKYIQRLLGLIHN